MTTPPPPPPSFLPPPPALTSARSAFIYYKDADNSRSSVATARRVSIFIVGQCERYCLSLGASASHKSSARHRRHRWIYHSSNASLSGGRGTVTSRRHNAAIPRYNEGSHRRGIVNPVTRTRCPMTILPNGLPPVECHPRGKKNRTWHLNWILDLGGVVDSQMQIRVSRSFPFYGNNV